MCLIYGWFLCFGHVWIPFCIFILSIFNGFVKKIDGVLTSAAIPVQASHSQFAEINFVKLLMYALSKWIFMIDMPLESKLSRCKSIINTRYNYSSGKPLRIRWPRILSVCVKQMDNNAYYALGE